MAEYQIDSNTEADPADAEAVLAGLRSYNTSHAGPSEVTKVNLFVRDSAGAVRGGLLGRRMWGWLHVEILWIEEALRMGGFGSQLLERAEAEAQEAGCTRAFLETLEFQALPFYEKHGYTVFGVLEHFPPGYRQYYLQKELRSR